jgi:hypothetical protein
MHVKKQLSASLCRSFCRWVAVTFAVIFVQLSRIIQRAYSNINDLTVIVTFVVMFFNSLKYTDEIISSVI